MMIIQFFYARDLEICGSRARCGSFVDKHKLAHIKKDLRTQDF